MLRALAVVSLAAAVIAKGPFLKQTTNQTWIFGNDLWNVTQGPFYATQLYSDLVPGVDLVGTAAGHYAGIDGENNLEWTSATIVAEGADYIDISFSATQGDFHWVVFDGLRGAYQYFVGKDLPYLEIFRSLWRLNPDLFLNGRTNIKEGPLPPFYLYSANNSIKVQDETWELPNGTFITKYDWSNFVRDRDYYGIYGPGLVGSWFIHPSSEYYSGSQLSQTLTVHRESSTGDSVQLNVVQDTSHFRVGNQTLPQGKTWGPWLWYLNNGSLPDVVQQREKEVGAFPYSWYEDAAYQSRGSVAGRLRLSDGRIGGGASVFLGDPDTSIRPLVQGAKYYYTVTAGGDGAFSFQNVRTGQYGLYVWADGGSLADVYTNVTVAPISIVEGQLTDLGVLEWALPAARTSIFRLGDFDKKSLGFKNSGWPYQHGITDLSPANLTFTVGASSAGEDWFYAMSALGTWTIQFQIDAADLAKYGAGGKALLSISLASYSQSTALNIDVNGHLLGSLSKDNLSNDPSLYRSSRISGEWHFFQYSIDPSQLVEGTNTIGFTVTRYVQWRGLMWDAIFLEWQG
ncbi:unnamed protein product [Mycena citricolor]|uniref:rhamnogalacturonan endolyase n=1 Tax=Mycena citricolor TaxID=2018698 RepID=A0AAD2HQD7_9AGAR|nr:unnamed protein product [Mycena citricolor]